MRKEVLGVTVELPDKGERPSPAVTERDRHVVAFFLRFSVLMALWVVLSGMFDAFHLSLGVLSSAFVAHMSSDLLPASSDVTRLSGIVFRFLLYIPWLILEIFKANLWLLYLVFHPRMIELIDPQTIKLKSKLESPLSITTFANSITLTPGTITIYVDERGYFSVHAIDLKSAQGLPGEMQEKIAHVFGEN
jgi:multicomponent Na+:H+ antiporter subunit E